TRAARPARPATLRRAAAGAADVAAASPPPGKRASVPRSLPAAGRTLRGTPRRSRHHRPASAAARAPAAPSPPATPVAPPPAGALELDGQATPAIPWGKDDDEPAAEVTLAPDLPSEAPSDDPDPLTHPLLEAASAALGDDIASVVGIRFVAGGRVQWCDA